ncbi:hypothetical protein KQI68_00830 [Peptoniphilus sp. MSJ-1]|uniref:DUF1700 domain-containing protein n=1 Tax=Peptoniphilus ovalis TaxID=2841503 RepID=A0ABS6FDW6_9FIRM|nr:hypothetical protein [Peptoniphilus ovalis]MBU5668376.1 hypothetical protein [Peptoniphilus ovalis]
MKLKEHELVDRYIYYLQRYIPYDKQRKAEEDFLSILTDRLDRNFTEEDLKNELNKMGNPYEFASNYTDIGNFLLSGKNYELFIGFLKMLTASAVIGFILFVFNYFNRLQNINLYDLFKTILISIFVLSLLPSWICEKIKTTKILKALMQKWDIENLYESKDFKIGKYAIYLLVTLFTMFFMLQIYIITATIDISVVTYTFIMFLFFINVLRANLKMSENTILSRILYIEYFVDIFTIISFIVLSSYFIPGTFMNNIIILCNVINLIINTYYILKEKNILISRQKRNRNKNKKRR